MAEVPLMMEFLFGEAAEAAQRGASRRLKRWAGAFDEWLRERGAPGQPKHKAAVSAWKRLLRQQGKMPFELRQVDIQQHAEWMKAEGYKPFTIYAALSMIAMFYRWCAERGVDAACGAEFNPAAGVARPKHRYYEDVQLMSREEVRALLAAAEADKSALGRREHAFFLLRLRRARR